MGLQNIKRVNMSILSNIFSGGASDLVGSVGKVLDSVITTKKEKLQLENEAAKAERDYQLENKKLDIQEKSLGVEDTKSAREMASAVQTSANATRLSKNVAAYLALGTVFLTFVLFFIWAFVETTQSQKEIVLYILGVLSAIDTQIFSFYFGSSQGSHNKQDVLNSKITNNS